ncbi:hypothetical protein KGQ27_03495 [Patescibacteria group bacterium]|nr:hypothetical protein [Patescibacteria group bacterium]MDE1946917.1 hypothetical protein [Patescibacteria group bacterium]MDE2011118.1 hypothetical protein [Patescibacteria group bacterium]
MTADALGARSTPNWMMSFMTLLLLALAARLLGAVFSLHGVKILYEPTIFP